MRHLVGRAVLGHIDSGGERRAAEHSKINQRGAMVFGTKHFRHARRSFQLHAMPLPVVERKRVAIETFR